MGAGAGQQIGGNLGDMERVRAMLADAGQGATAHVGSVTTAVETLQGELDDITATMTTNFETLAGDLTEKVDSASNALAEADWNGQSRAQAEAAEAAFKQQITATLAAALEGCAALGTAMSDQAMGFHTDITGQFRTIMTDIDTNYASLANGTQVFMERLAEDDANTIRFTA